MDGVTGNGPATEFPLVEPPPARIVGNLRRGPAPHIIIKSLRHRPVGTFILFAVLHHIEHADNIDFTQLAGLNVFSSLLRVGGAPRLHTYLDDPLVLAGRLNHLSALADIVRHRLFDIDVFAGLTGHDGPQRVPMVRSGVDNGIDVAIIEGLAEILNEFRPSALGFFDRLARPGETPGVGITEIGDFHVGPLGKTLGQICSSTAEAHHGYYNLVIGSSRLVLRERREGGSGASSTFHEFSTI